MTKSKKFFFSTVVVFALIAVLAVCLPKNATAKVNGEKVTFSIRGQEYQGEFSDEIDSRGNHHIEFISYLPINMSNYAVVVDVDAPVGDNIKIIDDDETLDELFGKFSEGTQHNYEVTDSEFCFYTRREIVHPEDHPDEDWKAQWLGVYMGELVTLSNDVDYDYDNDIMIVTFTADYQSGTNE